MITCTTTTGTGFLSWRNSQEISFIFDKKTASVGASGTLGSMTMTLNSIESVSNAMVYTSTATVYDMTKDTTIQCSDGHLPQSIHLYVKSMK